MDSPDDLSISLAKNVEALYGSNPWVRGLAQLIPLGSAADALISTALTNAQRRSARIFFEELDALGATITAEQINDNDFLHAYFATANAASRTRHEKKIRLFAHLLVNRIQDKSLDAGDKYEDFLKILDELTFREIKILTLLYQFERNTVAPDEPVDGSPATYNTAKSVGRSIWFWGDFIREVEIQTGIPHSEISGFLLRLTRTGFYQATTNAAHGAGGSLKIDPGLETVGILTANFYTFIEALGKRYHDSL